MKWLRRAAIGALTAAVVATVLVMALAYPYASTIKGRVAKAGPPNIVRDAEALFADEFDPETSHIPVASVGWPPTITSLKPSKVFVRNDGVYIECGKFFPEEWGVFVPAPGSSFTPEPGTDPAFEKLAERVYYYRAKG